MRTHRPLRVLLPSLVAGAILGLATEAQAGPVQTYDDCTVASVMIFGSSTVRTNIVASCPGFPTHTNFNGYSVAPDASCPTVAGTAEVVREWSNMAQMALVHGKHLQIGAWWGPGPCLDAIYTVRLTP